MLILAFCLVSFALSGGELSLSLSLTFVSVDMMSNRFFFVSLFASMHVCAYVYVIQCLGLDAYGCKNCVFF